MENFDNYNAGHKKLSIAFMSREYIVKDINN